MSNRYAIANASNFNLSDYWSELEIIERTLQIMRKNRFTIVANISPHLVSGAKPGTRSQAYGSYSHYYGISGKEGRLVAWGKLELPSLLD